MPIRIDIIPDPSFIATRAGLLRAAASKPARMAVSAHAANLILLAALNEVTPAGEFHTTGGARLKDSYGSQTELGDPTVVRFSNTQPYFKFVDKGHGDIYPVNAKMLRFEVAAGVVYARHVGPTPAQELRVKAAQRAIPALIGVLQQHALMVREAIQGRG